MLAKVLFLLLLVNLQFNHAVAWLAKVIATSATRHGGLKIPIKKTVVQPVVALYSTSSKTWGPANDLGLSVMSVFTNKQSTDVYSF
jgi:hypothetical protein